MKPRKPNFLVKRKGINSLCGYADFAEGREYLRRREYRIINLEQNAKLRIQEGKDDEDTQKSNWVAENFIYSSGGVWITKPENAPITRGLVRLTEDPEGNWEYFLTEGQVEQAIEGAYEVPKKQKPIPFKRFAEDGLTVRCFGKRAEDYGNFLRDALKGIPGAHLNLTIVQLASPNKRPFAMKTLFGTIHDILTPSAIEGYFHDLMGGGRVRGIKE